ncbi:MAG: antitoxin [Candidatus Woesearchaeota archaeon]
MVYARIVLDDYANKVLNVIKAKFGLNDKSEAINKFVEMFGDEIVEKEANEEYTKKILKMCDEHMKKHPNRRMSMKELDHLCEVS